MEKFPHRRTIEQLRDGLPNKTTASPDANATSTTNSQQGIGGHKFDRHNSSDASIDDHAAFSDFRRIDAKFDALPATSEPNLFPLEDTVRYPDVPGSTELVEWKIVRAEKKHYLLERTDENHTGPGYVMCAESELADHNQPI